MWPVRLPVVRAFYSNDWGAAVAPGTFTVAQVIDGKAVAAAVRQEVRARVASLGHQQVYPGLATVLVGDDPASQVYVRSKQKACEEVGMRSFGHVLPAQTTQPQRHTEAVEKRRDVPVIRIVIEHLVKEPFESAVVDDGQDAKRTIVQLVGSDVTREVSQAPVEVARPHLPGRLFSPRLPPSFGWWRRGQKPDDRATNASWQLGRASHPPRRVARPWK